MIETSRMRISRSRHQEGLSDPTKGTIFQIIQSSANDNVMPATKWFTRLIAWTIIVGGALVYVIF